MSETANQPVPPLQAVHVNITAGCNLGCSFCYASAVRGNADKLPIELLDRLIDDCAELGVARIILSGGEPMSRPDWTQIAQRVDAANIEVSIATNGTLITEKTAEFLAGLKQAILSISLDGDETVHDELRGRKGAHRQTTDGLRFLKAAGVHFDVNATLFRYNLSEVAALTKIARDLGCTMRLTLLHPNGRGAELSTEILSIEQILRVREFCHTMRKNGINIYLNLPPLLQYLDEIIPNRGAACGWAKNFCGVLANGDVTICGVAINEPALVAGSLYKQSFRDIWSKAQLFDYTRSLDVHDLKGVCGMCPFRDYCGGACRLSAFRIAGDFLAPYELCQRFYENGYIPSELLSVGAMAL